ncbi:GPO family capsid scaffolding protein [Aeromonas jandaei]
MNISTLRTGWVCIATEGTTVDGREITAAWLTDMAETYDPEYYTALIWPDHDRWSNFGYVQELKTEVVDGKLKLFAILSPTRDLVYYNQVGQYQFCSIEPQEQFADLGRTYLRGLGVTDEPASTGTTHLKFKDKSGKSRLIGTSEPLDLSTFKLPKNEKADGLITKFFSFLASHGEQETKPTPSHPEDEEMTKEQFELLNGTLTSLGEQFASISAKLDAKPDTKPDPAPEVNTDGDKEKITADQFSKLEETIKGLTNTVGELKGQIDKFSVELPDQRPSPLGGDDNKYQVC